MITITQIEYLLAVHQELHFGKAAKACHVSQPSLSVQIQKLEDELENVIFDRSKKPILVTDIGKEIIAQAKVIMHEHKKLKIIADMKATEPKGDFRLAVIPTLSSYVIPLFIGEFGDKYPKVNLRIDEYKTEDIIKLLVDDEIDAGLLVTPLGDDQLIERHLFYEPFYCYVNEEHQLAKKQLVSGADLERSGLWLLSEGNCFREQVLNICSMDKNKSVFPNIKFESGNLETLIKLVKTHSGFTLLPKLAVDSMAKTDVDKHIKKFKKPIPTREVSLVYTRSFLKEQIITALESSILANLPKQIKSLKRQNIEVIDI